MAQSNDKTRQQVAEQAQEKDLWAISQYLQSLTFTPRVLGVDEADVWKKLEKLCQMYEQALATERGKNAKLARQLKLCAAKLESYTAARKKTEEARSDEE